MLAIRGTIGVGDIQAFIQYVKNFTQPIQQIAQVINQVQSMTAASERVFEFLEEEEEDQEHEGAVSVENVTGEVKFSHVNFGYNPNQTIINDFSVDVKPGQKIAIVGPTGAGKTTMVKLLMRFYDVNSGQILLDNHDVRDYNRRDLRKAFGMVLQDTWLYKGTIMEISVMDVWMQQMKKLSRQQKQLMQTALSEHFRAVTTWNLMKMQAMYRRDRNSFSLLREQFLQTVK